ncbi:MAG: DUF3071 domain-containing protein, partial [Rhodococcus sp. (in: high G+C Gram-positive bacteria)]|nr:DUF3071 domain-containing protein [Rhodococcus sp. (in: high G+C Gram-positive bacteria)]
SEIDAETIEVEVDDAPTPEPEQPRETVTREPRPAPKPAAGHTSGKDKRGKPAMPSWEDVLLGVRSSGHN